MVIYGDPVLMVSVVVKAVYVELQQNFVPFLKDVKPNMVNVL